VHYHLQCDAVWRLVRALVRAGHGASGPSGRSNKHHRLWRIDGADAPELSGCEDIDLMATP